MYACPIVYNQRHNTFTWLHILYLSRTQEKQDILTKNPDFALSKESKNS